MRSRSPSVLFLCSAALLTSPAMADEDCCGGRCADGVCSPDCDCSGDCDGHCCHPPEDFDGCTPGYWKQDHHFDSWPADLSPDDAFADVFGVDAFPGLTLLDVLEQGGGGIIALGRHSVAALLNSLHVDVSYAYTDSQVLSGFENAYDSGDYNKYKDGFEDANEQSCPLN